MSVSEKQKWCHFDDFDSDSSISMKLPKTEDDDKSSCGFSQLPSLDKILNTSFSQKKLIPEKERHAELFRKDLISAMKLPDSEMLQPEEYFQILDPWKLEWERGVQVPINPGAILPNVIRVIPENENLYGLPSFKQPKKYLHACQDDAFKAAVHELHEGQKLTEMICRYDLDDLDLIWLEKLNDHCDDMGLNTVTELEMEKAIEEMETCCHTKLQEAQKTIEGLGIEYDENVVCDVCRSPEGEDSNEMVFCDSCDICVHQACYGIQMIPEGNWLCRVCALGIKPQCVLCPNSGGAMKSTKSGSEWAHISCALWIPEVHIGCPEKMEPINNINQIPTSRWALVCTLCRERNGACIQCSVKSCKTSFHVTCAFQHNLEMHQTYDETKEDVQMKAFCPKHSGQKNDDSVNEGDVLPVSSPKPQSKPELTEEEKTELRSHRLRKLEEEFYNYVTPKEVAEVLGLDEEIVAFIYSYWVLKRKSQFDRPLLMPKLEEGDILLKQREDGLVARLKMFIHLRQELERVRNLCYMVSKREKLSRHMCRMKEDIFQLLTKAVSEDGFQCDLSILNSCRSTNTIYDHPAGILTAARLLEQQEQAIDAQEMQSARLDKGCDLPSDNGDGKPIGVDVTGADHLPAVAAAASDKLVFDEKDVLFKSSNVSDVKSDSNDVKQELVTNSELCLSDDSDDLVEFKGKRRNGGIHGLPREAIWKKRNRQNSAKNEKDMSEGLKGSSRSMTRFISNFRARENFSSDKSSSEERANGQCTDEEVDPKSTAAEQSLEIGQEVDQTNDHAVMHESLPVLDLPDTGWLHKEKEDKACKKAFLPWNIPDSNSTKLQPFDDSCKEDVVPPSVSPRLEEEFHSKPSDHCVTTDGSVEVEQLQENKVPLALDVCKPVTATPKRRREGSLRRSKRSRLSETNNGFPLLEKTDTAVISFPDSSNIDQRVKEEEENVPTVNLPASQDLQKDDTSGSPPRGVLDSDRLGPSPASKVDELKRWSTVKTKFSPSVGENVSEIFQRFSPEQLVVSKEIKQKVESCLLKLPCLKSFNGLCKHLQQRLTECNLRYTKPELDSSEKNEDSRQNGEFISDDSSKLKRSTKLTLLKSKNSVHRKDESSRTDIWKTGSHRQLRTVGNATAEKEFKYNLDPGDLSEETDEFVPLQSINSSRSIAGNDKEHKLETDLDESLDTAKSSWLLHFKR